MPVTIESIARRAGVSAGTVSRVLNGKNKENRPAIARRSERIRRIASELGYRPNAAARSMLRGRFGMVAFVTCGDLGFDWFPPTLLHGIHRALERIDSRLILNEVAGHRFDDPEYVPRLLRETAVDGLLVNIDSKLPATLVPFFESQPVPCVLVNIKRDVRCVHPDDLGGGRMATRYLLERGCRRPGYIKLAPSGDTAPHYSEIDRERGFVEVLEEAGLPAHRRWVGFDGYHNSKGNGAACVDRFFERFPDTDALVCYSPEEAMAVSLAGARRGWQLPRDFPVVVFHEREMHCMMGVALPTAIIPFKAVGERAVEALAEQLEGEGDDAQPPASVAVPYADLFVP